MSFFWARKSKIMEQQPVEGPDFYAQYRVFSDTPSEENLPFVRLFGKGEEIRLANSTTILLSSGYLYLVNFLFIAAPGVDSYVQILPIMNGTSRGLYSFYAPSGDTPNTSASGSFTTNEADESELRLSFRVTYPKKVRRIDLSGSVSITPLMAL